MKTKIPLSLSVTRHLAQAVLSPQRAREEVLSLAPGEARGRFALEGILNVACLQLKAGQFHRFGDWLQHMAALMGEALKKESLLVCLPKYSFLELVRCLPSGGEGLFYALRSPEAYRQLLEGLGDYLCQLACEVFDALAQRYGVYLAAGVIPTRVGDSWRHRMYLFGGEGEPYTQDELSPGAFARQAGITPGEELAVKQTAGGTFLRVGEEDLGYYEDRKIGAAMGADVVVTPSWENPDVMAAVDLPRLRAQEENLFVVRTAAVCGGLNPVVSGAYGPVALSRMRDGIIRETARGEEERVLTARLDLDRLHGLVDLEVAQRSPELEAQLRELYFPEGE